MALEEKNKHMREAWIRAEATRLTNIKEAEAITAQVKLPDMEVRMRAWIKEETSISMKNALLSLRGEVLDSIKEEVSVIVKKEVSISMNNALLSLRGEVLDSIKEEVSVIVKKEVSNEVAMQACIGSFDKAEKEQTEKEQTEREQYQAEDYTVAAGSTLSPPRINDEAMMASLREFTYDDEYVQDV
jgi:hypothetical protein